jgi:hypothetical protein
MATRNGFRNWPILLLTKNYRGEPNTVIEDLNLPSPVIRSHYGNGFINQYVRDHVDLRILETFVDRGQLRKTV